MMKNGELFLIDFGLATFYVDENFKHIECKRDCEYIIGTPKYISYNIHDGWEPSRRDDLISLGYLYLEIHMGSLPWTSAATSAATPTSNLTSAQINQERKQLKSWNSLHNSLCQNMTKPIIAQSNTKIYKYMEECYQLQYYEVCKWIV